MATKTVEDLLAAVRRLQGDRTQEQFAKHLGVDQSLISRFLSREIGLGSKLASALLRKYPELADSVTAFLVSDMHRGQGIAS